MCNRTKYGLEKLKIYSNQKQDNNIGKSQLQNGLEIIDY